MSGQIPYAVGSDGTRYPLHYDSATNSWVSHDIPPVIITHVVNAAGDVQVVGNDESAPHPEG